MDAGSLAPLTNPHSRPAILICCRPLALMPSAFARCLLDFLLLPREKNAPPKIGAGPSGLLCHKKNGDEPTSEERSEWIAPYSLYSKIHFAPGGAIVSASGQPDPFFDMGTRVPRTATCDSQAIAELYFWVALRATAAPSSLHPASSPSRSANASPSTIENDQCLCICCDCSENKRDSGIENTKYEQDEKSDIFQSLETRTPAIESWPRQRAIYMYQFKLSLCYPLLKLLSDSSP
jgi:hypothetical protein